MHTLFAHTASHPTRGRGEINEGRTKPEDLAKVKSLAEHISQALKGHRFRASSQFCMHLCEWIVATSAYQELSSEMAAKRKQQAALQKDLQDAQRQVGKAVFKLACRCLARAAHMPDSTLLLADCSCTFLRALA